MSSFTYTRLDPDTLANGRPLGFGDTLELADEDLAPNQRLIDEGALIPVAVPTTQSAKAPNRKETTE
jgi:hypothetical protein